MLIIVITVVYYLKKVKSLRITRCHFNLTKELKKQACLSFVRYLRV